MSLADENKLYDYLSDPENLETALELEVTLHNLKKIIFQKFWNSVKSSLTEKLMENKYDTLWEVRKVEDVDFNWSRLGIHYKLEGGSYFYVGANCLTGKPEACSYGIVSTKEIPGIDLVDELKIIGFKPASLWAGWRYFHKKDALPYFDITNKQEVIELNLDNRAGGHKAQKVSDLLWRLFYDYREKLERLNAIQESKVGEIHSNLKDL